ncbi:2-dehydropantoate 2-reductase [Mesorhizobium sp. BE184]|uniref:ketopantoate reductase family protein n=1 Tax=Mesorhizobium sp. BE184 TaxID=2817714 RepID=UPI0028674B60|nr:2-dehydropantoate 2-reductase [Mesorhizobium sp. BE184]MDR7033859.1 2-dehydropantoate 2-reductase [Mesorhizobium sp. BE184]
MNIAVMGAGAVGCYMGAILAKAGHAVTLIGRPQHVEAARQSGLLLESKLRFTGHVPMQATTEPDGVAGADIVLFCVKSTDTEATGRQIAPYLGDRTAIICLQNGVDNAERLRAVIGHTTIPAAVYVATEMAGPGHVKHHGRGDLIIGASLDSDRIAEAFTASGIPTVVSDNAIGALWSKLIVNCAYNALSAIPQLPYGRLLETDGVKEVMQDVLNECLAVARAAGVTVPAETAQTVANLAASMPNQYASTAQDIARGRPTEIEHLNGYVVRKGDALGVPTPVNRTLLTLVRLIEAKALS